MASSRTFVTDEGRIAIPAEVRRELGLQPETEVVLDVAEGELRIRSVQRAVARGPALLRHCLAPGARLTDELIRERHEAAEFQ